PSPAARECILLKKLRACRVPSDLTSDAHNGRDQDVERLARSLAESTHGFVAADLENLCREARFSAILRRICTSAPSGIQQQSEQEDRNGPLLDTSDLSADECDFEDALTRCRPSTMADFDLRLLGKTVGDS